MNSGKLRISPEQAKKISTMLQEQGINQNEIEQIINGNYEEYESEYDLEKSFGGLKKYGDLLEKLSDGYSMEELKGQGISSKKIQDFNEMLTSKNLTVDNAKAIYQYSVGSNMILGVKRGVSKESIKTQIMSDLEQTLQKRGVEQSTIEEMKQLVKDVDYNSTLHSNYDIANQYMEKMGLQQSARVSVRTAISSMDRCTHIDQTIASLEDGLGKTQLEKPMKLYRAVKSSYLEKGLKDGEDFSSLIGKSISNRGQTSTSPLYDSSFAKYDEYDTVFEIFAPQGSRGSNITELSAYDSVEQEVLLNPNDLYITDVQTGVIDKNGRTKNVLQALCLSKDRECYKEVEQSRTRTPNKTESLNTQNYELNANGSNLPARQSRFSKFFNQFRKRFSRGRNEYQQQASQHEEHKQPNATPKKTEKKSWELEPEEKARIQKETAKIAQKHREQQEQQKQNPQYNIQQGQGTNTNETQEMQQGPIPQQTVQAPVMDMGGMEL